MNTNETLDKFSTEIINLTVHDVINDIVILAANLLNSKLKLKHILAADSLCQIITLCQAYQYSKLKQIINDICQYNILCQIVELMHPRFASADQNFVAKILSLINTLSMNIFVVTTTINTKKTQKNTFGLGNFQLGNKCVLTCNCL